MFKIVSKMSVNRDARLPGGWKGIIMPIYTIAGIIITFHCKLKRKSSRERERARESQTERERERERERRVAFGSVNLRVHHQSYVVSLKKNPP